MSNMTDKKLKTQEGIVVSDKMDKSVVVEVQRFTRHPLYERVLRRSTRFHAHDEQNRCHVGDRVLIAECRPISKMKCWRVVDILVKAE